jgi:hypothetical protein
MIRVALIIDGNTVTKWQKDALENVSDLLDIRLVLSCTNTHTKKNLTKHFLYYALNLFTLKNYLTRRVNLEYDGAKFIQFDSIYEGAWQKIPDLISREFADLKIDIVIKLGMSLLRVDGILSQLKILSFHHGDPTYFRGRPAGFYELIQRKGSVGTIVQELSNKLDAGKVWAISHSKVHHHSYKKTAINFYANSQFLLRKAFLNLSRNTPIDISSEGKNYRLPSNLLVLKFISIIFLRKLKRLLYGAFYEKKWNIATSRDINVFDGALISLKTAKLATIVSEYNFYADPFFSSNGKKIRLEALSSKNGLGEILEIDAESLTKQNILLKGDHYSYPFSFLSGTEEYLIPEVASHSPPYVLPAPFTSDGKVILKGMEQYRIVDSTILEFEGIIYLFCGMNSSAADCLYLFHSKGFQNEFISHPLNPIVIDPSRARMGGRIILINGRLYRFGQDNSYGYGDGLSVCEIIKLSTTDYEEQVVGSLRFKDASGPHTIDLYKDESVFDFYIDKFSLMAWYRRIAPFFLRRLKKTLG